jgi:hypothetical protein
MDELKDEWSTCDDSLASGKEVSAYYRFED